MVVSAPEGEMLSQFAPPPWTDALAVKLVALVALTARFCALGDAPPTVALKVREVGFSVTGAAAGATVRRTPTVCVPRDVRREMVPL